MGECSSSCSYIQHDTHHGRRSSGGPQEYLLIKAGLYCLRPKRRLLGIKRWAAVFKKSSYAKCDEQRVVAFFVAMTGVPSRGTVIPYISVELVEALMSVYSSSKPKSEPPPTRPPHRPKKRSVWARLLQGLRSMRLSRQKVGSSVGSSKS